MRYELIPKDVLDDVSNMILEAKNRFAVGYTKDQKNTKLLDDIHAANLHLDKAYSSLQTNRTQCNVRPEDGT